MNNNNLFQSSAIFGAGFWFLGAVFVQNTNHLFTPENQVFHLAAAPIVAKLSIVAMKKILDIKTKPDLFYSLSVASGVAFLLDGFVISFPSFRNMFYGTKGDFTLQAAWLIWGAGSIFFAAILD